MSVRTGVIALLGRFLIPANRREAPRLSPVRKHYPAVRTPVRGAAVPMAEPQLTPDRWQSGVGQQVYIHIENLTINIGVDTAVLGGDYSAPSATGSGVYAQCSPGRNPFTGCLDQQYDEHEQAGWAAVAEAVWAERGR